MAPEMGVWYEAVQTFKEEWAGDVEPYRTWFFDQEKEIFDKAKTYLEEENTERLLRMVDFEAWEAEEEGSEIDKIEKVAYFEKSSRVFEIAKKSLEKAQVRRPVGIWFRPRCDTIYIRSMGSNNPMSVLDVLKEGEVKAGNVRSLALGEYVIGEYHPWTWYNLL